MSEVKVGKGFLHRGLNLMTVTLFFLVTVILGTQSVLCRFLLD